MKEGTESCEPQREAQVAREIKIGENACNSLTGIITRLEERLTPILRSEPPKNRCEEKDSEEMVALAGAIREINAEIMSNTDRIENILVRLEI